jgi:translation initiation factor IF-1
MSTPANKTLPGIVIEILPKALFKVRLDDGRVITTNLESRLRQVTVRVLVGQKVEVRLSAHDPHRGQISQVASSQ